MFLGIIIVQNYFNIIEFDAHVKVIFFLYTSARKVFKAPMSIAIEGHKVLKKDIDRKHLLAIDYGRKFTGVATHRVNIDPIIIPFGRIAYKSDEALIISLKEIIEEEFIDVVVLGVPHFTDGTESTMTKTVKAFGKAFAKSLDVPFYLQDETLSTKEAEDRMARDPRYNFQVDYSKIDAVAATIILEDFLNRSSDGL